jgi:ABC-type transporter Mla subunit MlaD
MVQQTLKKTSATLDELMTQDDSIKEEIRSLNKQRKTIKGAIRSIQRLAASLPKLARSPRRKKSAPASAAA